MSKLLLVEDDNNLREIYEARLQAEGYQIVTAKDGEEALAVAKAERPDLIISDVMMPKISGFEMLDILKNTDGMQNVKVIMLTALGQSDDQQRADKLGADRYLVKSQVTLEDIVRVTHELLEDGESAADTASAPAAEVSEAPAPVDAPEPEPVAIPAPEPVAVPPAAEPIPVVAPVPEPPVAAIPPAPDVPEPITAPAMPPVSAPPEPAVVAEPPITSVPPVIQLPQAADPVPPVDPVADTPVVTAPEPTPAEIEPEATAPSDISNQSSESIPALSHDVPSAEATSASDEEANVENQIEDFVQGASSEATALTPEAPMETPAATPETAATPDTATTTTDSSHDKVMEDAVKSLMGDSTTTPAPAEPVTPAPTAAPEAPAEPTPAETPAGPEAPAADTTDTETPVEPSAPSSSSTMSHNKVIAPLANTDLTEKKPDIQALLAQEEAKEAGTAAPQPVVGPDNSQAPLDPNSISL